MKNNKPSKRGRGRPSGLTEATKRKIIEAVTLGCTYSIAASYAQIHESTIYMWLSKGRDASEGIYYEFYREVKYAEGISAVRSLAAIAQSAKDGNWTAAAWLLERRHGYTKESDRPSIDITVDVQNAEVTSLIEQVREHALQDVLLGPIINLDEE